MIVSLAGYNFRTYLTLNVREGRNVVRVRYFGVCKKLVDPSKLPPTPYKPSNYDKCAEHREIGSQTVVLMVHTNLHEKPGTVYR